MKLLAAICVALALFLTSPTAYAQEAVTLTTPVAKPAVSTLKVDRVTIDYVSRAVTIQVSDNTGTSVTAYYTTPAPSEKPSQPTGAVLISTLNSANLSASSLVKRVLQRLQTDGYIAAGSVTGTPQ